MTNSIITPDVLIQKRDNLIVDIKNCWSILNTNNVFKNGTKQPYDLDAVYNQIKKSEMELVKTKVALQAINMGLSKLSDLPESNSLTSVFTLSQVKERMVKLKLMPTKKKEDGESVHFTRTFIETEVKALESAKAKIEEELTEFNKNSKFQM